MIGCAYFPSACGWVLKRVRGGGRSRGVGRKCVWGGGGGGGGRRGDN